MIDLSSVPASPGCYLYKNEAGDIIYVGKAKNLKRRVSSYFQKRDHDPKTRALVKNIRSADFIVTANEVEALILENTLIKKHDPKYNIDLKDSKSYAFIHLSGDAFPRIGILRKSTAKGKLFGPFVSAKERDYLLTLLKKTFRLRSCRTLPKRPCLRAHMGTCSAPCAGKISREAYMENVEKAEAVLRGSAKELADRLAGDMKKCAAAQDFERAIDLREQLTSLRHLNAHQNMERRIAHNEDVVSYLVRRGRVYMIVFNVVHGTLVGKEEFSFGYEQNFLEEFLVRYYSEHPVPGEIILPEASEVLEEDHYTAEGTDTEGTDTEGTDTVQERLTAEDMISRPLIEFLSRQRGKSVRLTVPKRGDKKDLLMLAEKNIEIAFFGGMAKVGELGKKLMLDKPPSVIECFDVSHLSGTSAVASMVQFRDGKADKSNYRRFRIKTVEGIDDFASIAEVVERRYGRLLDERGDLPDLIVIDGGKGQLSAAAAVLRKLGVRTPVVSLAEREEEVFVPGLSDPLPIRKNEKASLYLQEIRDEAHRFAVTYNRLLRGKALRQEAEQAKKHLQEKDGEGEERAEAAPGPRK